MRTTVRAAKRHVRIASLLIGMTFVLPLSGQPAATLPRSTPEAQGVSSTGLLRFLEAVDQSDHELHSVMVLRHGQVIAEGWWHPYRADLPHTLYSTSKSFTATAVGFAVSEKRITVDDKVVTFFPDDLPDTVSPNLSELRIRDLLTMSVGHDKDPTGPVSSQEHWIKAFLATPIVHKPGTQFVYNSVATYMLSAIVQKVTGDTVLDYLTPRLFAPLGIEGVDWETDPQGINTGGWGLRLKTEDMAKFGQLFLQKGMWQGKQILPAAWIAEATSLKIIQNPDATESQKASNDWLQGYCYQMWRCRHNAYRADGAYGQYIIVMPDQDAVIAITAETNDMQSELNLVWTHLLPAMEPGPLPANRDTLRRLRNRLASLKLPLAAGGTLPKEARLSGKTFELEANEQGVTQMSLAFENDLCQLTLRTDTGDYLLGFGRGQWHEGETQRLGPYLVSRARNNRAGLPPFKVAGAFAWTGEDTLSLTLRYIESPHTETMRCSFDGDQVRAACEDLFHRGDNKIVLNGRVQ
ncbi:MAG: beta-lactamase family protein [Phycisphaerae bacterium]|nr:beta-lactamase family protein [Phycisphaerae bacterium]